MKIMQTMAGGQFGGAEEFFLRLVAAFNARGVSQSVVVRPNKARGRKLRDAGVNPVELPFGKWFDFKTQPSLTAQIDRVRPDIVLSWMNRATLATGNACLRADASPIQIGRQGGYYDLKYYRHCDHLIGNTPHIVKYMVDCGWPADCAHFIPNFVSADPGVRMSRGQFDVPEHAPLILAAGRLHQNKAFDTLLEALKYTNGVYLLLAGDGPLKSKLESLSQKLGVASRVRFIGWRSDVDDLMASVDMLVCPSRIEPLGNVVIEAWARNLPVVATAAEGPGWLITNESDGLLVPIDDYRALGFAITQLAEDLELSARVAVAGKLRFESEFNEATVVDRFLALFEEVSR